MERHNSTYRKKKKIILKRDETKLQYFKGCSVPVWQLCVYNKPKHNCSDGLSGKRLIWQRLVLTCCLLKLLNSCIWQHSCKCLSYLKISLTPWCSPAVTKQSFTTLNVFLQAKKQEQTIAKWAFFSSCHFFFFKVGVGSFWMLKCQLVADGLADKRCRKSAGGLGARWMHSPHRECRCCEVTSHRQKTTVCNCWKAKKVFKTVRNWRSKA